VWTAEGKRPLGRHRLRCEYNIKMGIKMNVMIMLGLD
jgi:hypothetical protein